GKSPTSALGGHTEAHNATLVIMAIPAIISFFNIPSPFSNRHYHRQREISTHISLKLLKCRININEIFINALKYIVKHMQILV
ncbi:MAG: hypothetical protein KGZ94_07125, partial [Clostridia bacterium]|nr:hypothetical protein [Clostridia bacterium]